MMKLPSNADIYKTALKKDYQTPRSEHLTHIFRIINHVTVLFPSLTKAVNVVGRYECERKKEMGEFYRIISMELVSIYGYLRFMVKQIL